ncbi:MAG: sigma-70 family RNA polymerase sigma factor [Spirochaetota bacterium]
MPQQDFQQIVTESKSIVLGAIRQNLFERFAYAIDDVAQETYLKAYKALQKNSFRGDAKISTWLYTIARNESLRMNRKLGKEEEIAKKLLEKQIQSTHLTNEAKLDMNPQDLLHKLPAKYKNVMELYIMGKSVKEISASLSINQGTVKSRTFRAKEFLQRLFTHR